MASYVQDDCLLDYTPGSAVAAGEVLVLGSLVAVAPRPIASGALGAVAVEGVWSMPCASGATGAQGSLIKWYATSGVAHAATGTNAGYLAADRLAGDTSVKVLLVPGAS